MRNVLAIFSILAACAANAAPSIPGYVPVTVKPGTNTVSNGAND